MDLIRDLDQAHEHHGPAGLHIDLIPVETRFLAQVGVEAVALKDSNVLGARRCLEDAPILAHLGIGGKREFSHQMLLNRSVSWGVSIRRRRSRCSNVPADSRTGSRPRRQPSTGYASSNF